MIVTPLELFLLMGTAAVAGAYLGAIVICAVMANRSRPRYGAGDVAFVRVAPQLLEQLLEEPSGPVVLIGAESLADGTYELTFKRVDAIVLDA